VDCGPHVDWGAICGLVCHRWMEDHTWTVEPHHGQGGHMVIGGPMWTGGHMSTGGPHVDWGATCGLGCHRWMGWPHVDCGATRGHGGHMWTGPQSLEARPAGTAPVVGSRL
jgi:hypothetical protein